MKLFEAMRLFEDPLFPCRADRAPERVEAGAPAAATPVAT